MTVHVVMPVFNRIEATRQMLDCLRAQCLDEALRIIVVDDGSTDGTAELLASQDAVTVVQGDGSLWWGGAVHEAIERALPAARDQDWMLLVNNDTHIEPQFVQTLLDVARQHPKSAVGSVIRHHQDGRLLSIGARIDPIRLLVSDYLDQHGGSPVQQVGAQRLFHVDALSGRGVLIPMAGLRKVSGMRPRWLPHYLADYELSLRLKSAGWQLLVSDAAAVYSEDSYGNGQGPTSQWQRLTSVRSPAYLPAQAMFWWRASTGLQRITLPARLMLYALFPSLRKPR